MSADQLAAIHAGKPPAEAEPKIQVQDQVATGPVPTTRPVPPVAPPPAAWSAPEAEKIPSSPSFLGPLLPPTPDDAVPTGERGDFVSRLIAGLIDYSPILALQIVSALLMPASIVVGGVGGGFGALAAIGCISILLFIAYLILVPMCWIKFGATPGKKIMKLRVVPETDPTGRIDLGMAVLRMLGYLVNGIISWIITLPFSAIFVMGALAAGRPTGGSLFLVKIISLAANVVPYLLILFTVERKGLHDMISKTVVIKVDR